MKKDILFYILIILFLLYNVITLSISPIVWTDEVFLNSVTVDFTRHHTFYSTADMNWVSGMQTLAYGPLYFIFQGLFIKLLGNSIFVSRLVGMLAGLILILVFTSGFRKGRSNTLFLLFICVITDEFIISSMHRARNDTLSILFYYSSIFVLLGNPLSENKRSKELTLSRTLLSGILLALSILTTIRTIFLIAPFIIIFIYKWKDSSFRFYYIKYPIIWGIIIAALYIPWIYLGFGNINEFFSYYQYLREHFSYFVGAWLRIPREVFPLFILFFIVAVAGVINSVIRKNVWYWVLMSIVVSYFLFVGDTGSPAHTHKSETLPFLPLSLNDSGPYSIIIIPVFYILIALCVQNILEFRRPFQMVLKTGVILLLLFNIGLFAIKNTVLFATSQSRDITKVNKFIHDNIPSGSNVKVCGDEIYYYAVANNNNPFHLAVSYQSKKDFPKVESYSRNVFDYDYIIISKRLEKKKPELVKEYAYNAKLVKVADYTAPQSALAASIAKKLNSDALEENYDGTIYKRIR